MAAKLNIRLASGHEFTMSIGNTATFGRSSSNDVVLPDPKTVSRQHAVIRYLGGNDYQIMDLGSRNGTFVDGRRVILPAPIRDGARITIEGNEIRFYPIAQKMGLDEMEVTLANSHFRAVGTDGEREVSMLVCDIRGFSRHSELMPPPLVSKVLGNWFREAGNIVSECGGVIDKFIGDALFAYWDEPEDAPNACERAVTAARHILELASGRTWPHPEEPFLVCAALHHGKVSHGNIGVDAQRDATIVGDAVNVTFRLEGVMKSLGLAFAMTEPIIQRIKDRADFADYGEHQIRGKSAPLRVFGCP